MNVSVPCNKRLKTICTGGSWGKWCFVAVGWCTGSCPGQGYLWASVGHLELLSDVHNDLQSVTELRETDKGDTMSDTPELKEILGVLNCCKCRTPITGDLFGNVKLGNKRVEVAHKASIVSKVGA